MIFSYDLGGGILQKSLIPRASYQEAKKMTVYPTAVNFIIIFGTTELLVFSTIK